MEDAHRVVDAYDGKKDQAFFGVYDGHGGGLFIADISIASIKANPECFVSNV